MAPGQTADLLGYSLGGAIAQVIVQQRPGLVRRVILAGTAPAGHGGPAATGAVLQAALEKAGAQGKHPKHFLFFSPTATSQAAADAFLARLDERTENRDAPVSNETIGAQLTALAKWEQGASPVGLTNVDKPRAGRQRRRSSRAGRRAAAIVRTSGRGW